MFAARASPLLRQAFQPLLRQSLRRASRSTAPATKPIRIRHGSINVNLRTVSRTVANIVAEACTLAVVKLGIMVGVVGAGGLLVWWGAQEAIDETELAQTLDGMARPTQMYLPQLCAAREEFTEQLNENIQADTQTRPVMLVTGMPGAGKSHMVTTAVCAMPGVTLFYVDCKGALADDVRTGCGINRSRLREWVEGGAHTVEIERLRRYLQCVEDYAQNTGKQCIFVVDNFDKLMADDPHSRNDGARVLADTMTRWTTTVPITSVVISNKEQASRYFRNKQHTEYTVNGVGVEEARTFLRCHLAKGPDRSAVIIAQLGLRMVDLCGFVAYCQSDPNIAHQDAISNIVLQDAISSYTKPRRRLYGTHLLEVLRSSRDDDRLHMMHALQAFVPDSLSTRTVQPDGTTVYSAVGNLSTYALQAFVTAGSSTVVGNLSTFHGLHLLHEQHVVYPADTRLAYQLPAPYMVQEVANVLQAYVGK